MCVLGCPGGVTKHQEIALASAARSAGWQVGRVGMDWGWWDDSKISGFLELFLNLRDDDYPI